MKPSTLLKFYYSFLCSLLGIVLWPNLVCGHNAGQSTLAMHIVDQAIQGKFNILLKDLPIPMSETLPWPPQTLSEDIKGRIEEQSRNFLSENMLFKIDGKDTLYTIDRMAVDNIDSNLNLNVFLKIPLPQKIPRSIEVNVLNFFKTNPQFTSLVSLRLGENFKTVVITAGRNKTELFVDSFAEFLNFVKYGITHIGMGLDHVLFIILLVFNVFLFNSKPYRFSSLSWNMIKMATAFTISHSLTWKTDLADFTFSFCRHYTDFDLLVVRTHNRSHVIIDPRKSLFFYRR